MSSLYNHEIVKEKTKPVEKTEEKLIKNQECIGCKNLFTCKGKPRETKLCINRIERDE